MPTKNGRDPSRCPLCMGIASGNDSKHRRYAQPRRSRRARPNDEGRDGIRWNCRDDWRNYKQHRHRSTDGRLRWTPSLRPRDAIFKLVFREAARVSSLRPFTRVLNPFGKERATIHLSRRPPSPLFGVPKITAAGGLFSRSGSEIVFFDRFDLWSNRLCSLFLGAAAGSHRFPSGRLATVALC